MSRPQKFVFFDPYIPNRRGVLIIPGGGYAFVSVTSEGADVAERWTARGYTAFVLVYRLPAEGWDDRADVPLQDAQRSVRMIKARAAEYGIDGSRLAVIGFSAGGHLAATLATRHGEVVYSQVDGWDRLSAKPFAAALLYPVIAVTGPFAHQGSSQYLLGNNASPAVVASRSPAVSSP